MQDRFGKVLELGHKVVYPTRPGGQGPLQLGFGEIVGLHDGLGEIDIEIGTIQGEPSRVVAIKRTDRVAIVTL